MRRLRATALAHSEKERTTVQELLLLLLATSTAKPEDASYVEIAAAARSAMASTLSVMSASDFIAGILTILESESIHVSFRVFHSVPNRLMILVQARSGAFELLGERLNEVAETARRALSSSIVKVVDVTRSILSTSEEVSLLRSSLQALATIGNTLVPGEEGSIAATVPSVLVCLSRPEIRVSALQTLHAFS